MYAFSVCLQRGLEFDVEECDTVLSIYRLIAREGASGTRVSPEEVAALEETLRKVPPSRQTPPQFLKLEAPGE